MKAFCALCIVIAILVLVVCYCATFVCEYQKFSKKNKKNS